MSKITIYCNSYNEWRAQSTKIEKEIETSEPQLRYKMSGHDAIVLPSGKIEVYAIMEPKEAIKLAEWILEITK